MHRTLLQPFVKVGAACDELSLAMGRLRRALGLVPEGGIFEANDRFQVIERRFANFKY